MIHISEEDFERAVKIANDAGKRGNNISLTYIPPQMATQSNGVFVTNETKPTIDNP